jgi:outer membrane protein, heavy metal efflux system
MSAPQPSQRPVVGPPHWPIRLIIQSAAAMAGTIALLLSAGCALTPEGTKAEQDRVTETGKRFEQPFEERTLPELPVAPTWADVLHRAFLANGDLESSYFEWNAAVQRIEIASAYPNSNVNLGYSYTFSSEQMKTFDRQTFSAGFDSMENLSLPSKVRQKGQVALDEARTSGERFRAAKFDLQRRVLSAWADYVLLAEQQRIQQQRRSLDQIALDTARARVMAGGPQQDLLRAEVAQRESEDAGKNIEAELAASRAMLNGMLARQPDAPLAAPAALPQPREIPADDAALLAAAVDQSPELAALAQQVAGRTDALELARMQWIPDINPSLVLSGSIAQTIGAGIVLPTKIKAIQGGIKEAEAMLRGSQATLRQARSDRAGSFVATLVGLRNAERQASLFEGTILPLTERVLGIVRQHYSAGSATYSDLIDAQRMVLDARLVVAEARAMREKRLAELEALMGTDVETLNAPPITPATTGAPLAAQPGHAFLKEISRD